MVEYLEPGNFEIWQQYYHCILNCGTIEQDFGAHILLNLHTALWDRLLPSPFYRWNQWGSCVVWNSRKYSCCYITTAYQLRGSYCPFFLPLGVRWKLKRWCKSNPKFFGIMVMVMVLATVITYISFSDARHNSKLFIHTSLFNPYNNHLGKILCSHFTEEEIEAQKIKKTWPRSQN